VKLVADAAVEAEALASGSKLAEALIGVLAA
jgi:hypothetical protein